MIRLAEMRESMKIVAQCLDRLRRARARDDRGPEGRVAREAEGGTDGIGNDPEYLRHIMEESMESLIHHFKMVTQGDRGARG